VTITESSTTAPVGATDALRFDELRSVWILSRGADIRYQLSTVMFNCLISVCVFLYTLEFPSAISIFFLIATISIAGYVVCRRSIYQIEIDVPRSQIRFINPSLFLGQRINYTHFSSIQFLRSVMITPDDSTFNALELVLKSGEASIEIARFNPTPVTDGSLSFRQIVIENSEAKALRKQFCNLTGIRDFGFLSSPLANPIDLGPP
jgi:hypothetical protein